MNKQAHFTKRFTRPAGYPYIDYFMGARNMYPTIDINTEWNDFWLVFIGDLHCGLKTFARSAFLKFRKWLLEKARRFIVILDGDLIECATRQSVGDAYQCEFDTDTQVNMIIDDLLQPIKYHIGGAGRGNHEFRANKEGTIDPMATICKELNVPYLGWELFGQITSRRYKNHTSSKSIYSCHSYSTNKTEGLALNWSQNELASWLHYDIIGRAHTHDMGHAMLDAYFHSCTSKAVSYMRKHLVMGGAWIYRMGSYAQQKPSRPKPMGTVALHIRITKGREGIKSYIDAYKIHEENDFGLMGDWT